MSQNVSELQNRIKGNLVGGIPTIVVNILLIMVNDDG